MSGPAAAARGAAFRDVGSLFLETAARLGERTALVHAGRETSFAALGREVEALARGFKRAGAADGARVAVLVPPSREFAAAAFALLRAGAVPVLIDPGIGLEKLKRCLAEAEPMAFVGSPKAHLARVLKGWAPSARLKVVAGGRFPGCGTLEDVRRLGEPAGALPALAASSRAAILFTSGSTGAPKGAVYEHGTFAAQLALLRETLGVAEGQVSVATFPLFALFDLALGLTTVLPDMDFTRPGSVEPMRIVEPVQRHGAAQLFGSPALIDRVGRFGERHGVVLPSLERVLSAGAPVPARTLARFRGLLRPEAKVWTPYGATEALPVALIESRELLEETAAATAEGAGVCVGRPVPGVEVALVRVEDGPMKTWSEELRVPAGQVGEIVVKGPVVTGEYFRRVEDMALAKIGDGASHRHRMGDLGRLDERGRLWYCGRKSERVRTPEGDLYTACVEGVLDAHPAVRRSALVGVRGRPVACVEREPGSPLSGAALRRELLALAASKPASRAVKELLFHPGFPVDIRHNAKIGREALAAWAARELA